MDNFLGVIPDNCEENNDQGLEKACREKKQDTIVDVGQGEITETVENGATSKISDSGIQPAIVEMNNETDAAMLVKEEVFIEIAVEDFAEGEPIDEVLRHNESSNFHKDLLPSRNLSLDRPDQEILLPPRYLERSDRKILPPPRILDRPNCELLPPPRTLDDAPLSRKRKGGRQNGTKRKVSNARLQAKSKIAKDLCSENIDSNESIGIVDVHSVKNSNIQSTSTGDDEEHHSNDIVNEPQETNKPVRERSSSSYNFRQSTTNIDYSFDSESEEEKEILDKGFSCKSCSFYFQCKKDLTIHERALHGKGGFKCDKCENSFNTASGLKRHVSLMHKKKQKTRGYQSKSEDTEEETPVLKSGLHSCSLCGKKYANRSGLYRHKRLHQGIFFVCPHCGKRCSEKHALISHIRFMHTGERPYKCTLCSKSFTTMSDLRRHMLVHSETRKFICSDCGKAFKTRSSLKAHIHLKTAEKTWKCGICDQMYASKGGLKAHMVIHSDIKNYECETCHRQFSHRASLVAHMIVHSGLMEYSCPECGKKFAHVQNRNRHVRTVHKDCL